jgi:hypothetical protein
MWLMFSPNGWVNIDNLKKGMWLVEDPMSILLEGVFLRQPHQGIVCQVQGHQQFLFIKSPWPTGDAQERRFPKVK